MTNHTSAYMVVIERAQGSKLVGMYGSLDSAMMKAESLLEWPASSFYGIEDTVCYHEVQIGCDFLENSRQSRNLFRFVASLSHSPPVSVFEINILP